jgi:hypothetical protein
MTGVPEGIHDRNSQDGPRSTRLSMCALRAAHRAAVFAGFANSGRGRRRSGCWRYSSPTYQQHVSWREVIGVAVNANWGKPSLRNITGFDRRSNSEARVSAFHCVPGTFFWRVIRSWASRDVFTDMKVSIARKASCGPNVLEDVIKRSVTFTCNPITIIAGLYRIIVPFCAGQRLRLRSRSRCWGCNAPTNHDSVTREQRSRAASGWAWNTTLSHLSHCNLKLFCDFAAPFAFVDLVESAVRRRPVRSRANGQFIAHDQGCRTRLPICSGDERNCSLGGSSNAKTNVARLDGVILWMRAT